MFSSKIHLSLNVADVKASTAWYSTFFGVEPHKVREGYANFDIESPGLKLALNQSGVNAKGALNHLGILVGTSQEVWDAQRKLKNLGMEVRIEEGEQCCHAQQDKFWVTDPDGNEWEIYTILDDNPLAVKGNEAGGCCGSIASEPCCVEEVCCQ